MCSWARPSVATTVVGFDARRARGRQGEGQTTYRGKRCGEGHREGEMGGMRGKGERQRGRQERER